jgi:hypothetical protein
MSEIKAGSYNARIVAYATKKTMAGEGAVVIQFAFEADGENHSITWQGGIKNHSVGKTTQLEITLKTLEVCGFDFTHPQAKNNLNNLALGVSSGVLDTDTEVSISVELKPNNTDGKIFANVKYVNRIGGAAFKNKMTQAETAVAFAGIAGDVMAFAAKTPKTHAAVPTFDSLEIPF